MLNLRPLSQWLFTDKDEIWHFLPWLPHVRAVTGKLVNRLAMLSRSSGVGCLMRWAATCTFVLRPLEGSLVGDHLKASYNRMQ